MELIQNLLVLLIAAWNVVISLLELILPWSPLILWVAFWLFAVDWVKLRAIMIQGGLIAVVLIGLTMILVWGVVAPPEGGAHHLLGLKVSNFVGKTVYVSALLTIMFLCGSVQLSGACGRLAHFPDLADDDDHGHDHGGHGNHGSQDHGSHDHGAHSHAAPSTGH